MPNYASMRNTGYPLQEAEQSDAPGPPPMLLMISIAFCGQVIAGVESHQTGNASGAAWPRIKFDDTETEADDLWLFTEAEATIVMHKINRMEGNAQPVEVSPLFGPCIDQHWGHGRSHSLRQF